MSDLTSLKVPFEVSDRFATAAKIRGLTVRALLDQLSRDPVGPGEQGGARPVVVVSSNAFNAWPVGHHVLVAGGGLDRPSFAMPEYVRSVAQRRLQRHLGAVDQSTLATVDDWLRRLTGL